MCHLLANHLSCPGKAAVGTALPQYLEDPGGSVLAEMLFLPCLKFFIRITQQREHRLWNGDNFFSVLDVQILSCYTRRVCCACCLRSVFASSAFPVCVILKAVETC